MPRAGDNLDSARRATRASNTVDNSQSRRMCLIRLDVRPRLASPRPRRARRRRAGPLMGSVGRPCWRKRPCGDPPVPRATGASPPPCGLRAARHFGLQQTLALAPHLLGRRQRRTARRRARRSPRVPAGCVHPQQGGARGLAHSSACAGLEAALGSESVSTAGASVRAGAARRAGAYADADVDGLRHVRRAGVLPSRAAHERGECRGGRRRMVPTGSEGSFGRLTRLLQWLQINCQAAHDDITK